MNDSSPNISRLRPPGGATPAFPACVALLRDYGAMLRAEAEACQDPDGICRDDADAARINQMMRLYQAAWRELMGSSQEAGNAAGATGTPEREPAS